MTAPEQRRLATLDRLHILDTETEESFDRLTRAATRLTGAPVALAVFVDGNRQFFKSQVGLAEPWASRRETPLSHSFCQHVVADNRPLIVEDARVDPRLADNLAIRDLGVIAYAGVPLVCDGTPVGSFCVIDTEPREWSADDVEIVRDLAQATMAELALRVTVREQADLLEELSLSEQRYRGVVAAMEDGVVVQQADGEITACNEAAERILGLTADQMMGRTSTDPAWRSVHEDGSAYPGQDHPSMVTLRTGKALRRQIMGVHKPGGELTWISVSTEPVRTEDELTPRAVIATFTDITRQRHDEEEMAAHLREQEALTSLATLVASEASPRAVFAAAAEHMVRVHAAQGGGVVRVDEGGEARLVGAWAPDMDVPSVGEVVDMRLPTATAKALRTQRRARAIHSGEGESSLPQGCSLASPVEVNGRFWGVVTVHGGVELAEDPEADARLGRFAHLVELAIAGADAREQLARLASVDHLTGLYNQRAFSDRLDEEVRRARRHGRALSLLVFDLDHFKLVNDTFGHDAGNRALAEFAQRLVGLRRGGEVVARIGGEEFAWLLPDTDGVGAFAAAERARRVVAGTPFAEIGRVTTSVGVCALSDAADAQELFRHADLALYWAKSTRRNSTFRYSPEALELIPADEQAHRLERAKALAAIRALAGAVDAKDASTQRHSERVADLAAALADQMGWDSEGMARLKEAALVHDVGKIGVPDSVLLKPGALTDDEYAQVKTHAELGAQMLDDVLSEEEVSWVRHHHEAYDGRGYPSGLKKTEIPEGARIIGVADAWDAMTVARPYGAPRSVSEALGEVRRYAGRQFCPDVVRALEQVLDAGKVSTPPN